MPCSGHLIIHLNDESNHTIEFNISSASEAIVASHSENAIQFDMQGGWIVRADNNERLIYIPPDYQPFSSGSCGVFDQTFVYGRYDGSVHFLRLQLDSSSKDEQAN
ncbi:hypothetical protein N7456_011353 [Penicillium angulare]|uniref:Uncharacterized protein n=1 Tax=Penicillium angulare TaxID=116970 RepID=A0A9W9K0L8_9EURO|nr:hypothetical protein N7456_011353 [Penicillium angulare]